MTLRSTVAPGKKHELRMLLRDLGADADVRVAGGDELQDVVRIGLAHVQAHARDAAAQTS